MVRDVITIGVVSRPTTFWLVADPDKSPPAENAVAGVAQWDALELVAVRTCPVLGALTETDTAWMPITVWFVFVTDKSPPAVKLIAEG